MAGKHSNRKKHYIQFSSIQMIAWPRRVQGPDLRRAQTIFKGLQASGYRAGRPARLGSRPLTSAQEFRGTRGRLPCVSMML